MKVVGAYVNFDSSDETVNGGIELTTFLDTMKNEIGLNLAIPTLRSPDPAELVKSPFPRREKGFSVDRNRHLRTMIDEAHRREIDVWPCLVTFSEMADGLTYPELAVRDIEGNFVDPVSEFGFKWLHSWCPSNTKLHEAYKAELQDLTNGLDIDGLTVTHNRYSPLAHGFMNIFGCACENCQAKAGELGYDFGRMKLGLLKAIHGLKELNQEKIKSSRDMGEGIFDFLYHLGPDSALIDWLNFRCDVISDNLKDFKASARAGRESIPFGMDNFPPSFSLLAGHNYRDIEMTADFLSPLLPHPFIFIAQSFAETARQLLGWNKDLTEGDCLALLYHLFGYERFNLPSRLDDFVKTVPPTDFDETGIPLMEIVRYEAQKASSYSSGRVPLYGVVAAYSKVSPSGCRNRVSSLKEAGMNGVILQPGGLPIPRENLRAVRDALGKA